MKVVLERVLVLKRTGDIHFVATRHFSSLIENQFVIVKVYSYARKNDQDRERETLLLIVEMDCQSTNGIRRWFSRSDK